jgi:hypothetical protein
MRRVEVRNHAVSRRIRRMTEAALFLEDVLLPAADRAGAGTLT